MMNFEFASELLTWGNLLVTLVLLTIARARAGTIVNPVTFALVVHYFHNWSFDIASRFASLESVIPDAPASQSIFEVKLTNFLGAIALCVPIIYFLGRESKPRTTVAYSQPIKPQFLEIAYLLTLPLPFLLVTGSALSGQALTSLEAYNPVGVLLLVRSFLVINTVAYRIYFGTGGKLWSLVATISLEGLFMIIFGWRKVFMIIICSVIIMGLIRWGLPKRRTGVFMALFAAIAIFLGQFVADTRQARTDLPLGLTFLNYLSTVREDPAQWLGRALVVASSEGVQYWAADLWSQSSVENMKGKTYAQAALNTFIPRIYQGEIRDWQAAYAFRYVAYASNADMGYDFSFSAEALINWGPYFSWISFFVLGLVWGKAWSCRAINIWWFNYTAVLFAVSIVAFRADSVAFARFVFVGTVPFYVISIVAARLGLVAPAAENVQVARRRFGKS